SNNGDVFYGPDQHSHDACIKEVKNCQILVLVVAGRFGGAYVGDKSISITQAEYREAFRLKMPIITLVDSTVMTQHDVFQTNRRAHKLDPTSPDPEKIVYPGVPDIRLFGFIDDFRKQQKGNGFSEYSSISDIERLLKSQLAGLMLELLSNRQDARQVE